MKYYFLSQTRQDALANEARRWAGTPFFHGSESLGHAVDCVRYAAALYRAAGFIDALTYPAYALDTAKHTTRSQLLDYLLTNEALAGRLVFSPVHLPRLPGDLYALRSGKTDHHLAMHLPYDQVTHAIEEHGVITHDASDEDFRKRILYILRPLDAVHSSQFTVHSSQAADVRPLDRAVAPNCEP